MGFYERKMQVLLPLRRTGKTSASISYLYGEGWLRVVNTYEHVADDQLFLMARIRHVDILHQLLALLVAMFATLLVQEVGELGTGRIIPD